MTDDRDFARDRSHQDAKVATEIARTAAWACILLDGGGAAATLAYGPPMGYGAPYALGLYAGGALLGGLALFLLFQWIERWNIHWEGIARGKDAAAVATSHKHAETLTAWVNAAYIAALLCFFAASTVLVVGMARLAAPAQ